MCFTTILTRTLDDISQINPEAIEFIFKGFFFSRHSLTFKFYPIHYTFIYRSEYM